MLGVRTHLVHPSTLLHRLSVQVPRASRLYAQNAAQPDHRASAKLFQDAEREEAELAQQAARADKLNARLNEQENWTGEERMEDAVLRMLVDKYKPLRNGPIRTAEEKLKQAPPRIGLQGVAHDTQNANGDILHADEAVVRTSWGPSDTAQSLADAPLLPSIEGHQPWHTTFTVPSHAQSSIKYGNIPSAPKGRVPLSELDDKARRKARDAKKRMETAGRIQNARESTLDYRLGVKSGKAGDGMRVRRNPATMKGWAALVEERIEKARQEGRFNVVQGRGQPIKQFVEERNPFIAREEFLMNRIVQRQGAAPPWIEIQGELKSAVGSFREVLRQSWTRRAIRILTLSHPAILWSRLTLSDVLAHRDAEWEKRERAYHDTALEELNSLVRKYNGLAPYAVRRPYYMLNVELEKAYQDCAEDILRGIAERANGQSVKLQTSSNVEEEERVRIATGGEELAPLRVRDIMRQWVARLLGR